MALNEKLKPQRLYIHANMYNKPRGIQRHHVSTVAGISKILSMWRTAEHWTITLVFDSRDQTNPFGLVFQDGKWTGPDNNFGYAERCSIKVGDHSVYKGLMAGYDVICSRHRCRLNRPSIDVCPGCDELNTR